MLALALVSCGYHTSNSLQNDCVTLSVPLITIDEEGELRNSLIKELSSTKAFVYSSSPSRYQLLVDVVEDKVDAIGYMWDRKPQDGKREDRLYPSEKRRFLEVKVRIIDTETNSDLVKPFYLSTRKDFDFVNPTVLGNIEFIDAKSQRQSVLQFSQGQLDSEEGGQHASYSSLFSDLASRIVTKLQYILIMGSK